MFSSGVFLQMAAPASVGMEAALGQRPVGGVGHATGIFEIESTVLLGGGVICTIVLMVVGFRLVSKIFRRAGAGGGGGGSWASDSVRDLSFTNRFGERMTPTADGTGFRTSDGRFFSPSGAQDARPKGTGLVSPSRPYKDG